MIATVSFLILATVSASEPPADAVFSLFPPIEHLGSHRTGIDLHLKASSEWQISANCSGCLLDVEILVWDGPEMSHAHPGRYSLSIEDGPADTAIVAWLPQQSLPFGVTFTTLILDDQGNLQSSSISLFGKILPNGNVKQLSWAEVACDRGWVKCIEASETSEAYIDLDIVSLSP